MIEWARSESHVKNKQNSQVPSKESSNHIKQDQGKSLYRTLVRPVVKYFSTAWDPYTAKNIKQMEMERRVAWWVLRCYDSEDSVADMLRNY